MFTRYLLTTALGCGGLVLSAQSLAQAEPWADISVPVQNYHSPLGQYHGWKPQAPGDWRQANDEVGRIGGWQSYAAEVWEASQSQSEDAAAPAPHPGHQHHAH